MKKHTAKIKENMRNETIANNVDHFTNDMKAHVYKYIEFGDWNYRCKIYTWHFR